MAEKAKGKGGAKDEGAAYSKIKLYKVDGEKVVRSRRACPKCGPGVYLARHKDRESCGNCGHTEFIRPVPPAKTG